MGALTRERNWQALLSVVVVLGLLFAGFLWTMFVFAMMQNEFAGGDETEFWWVVMMLVTMALSYTVLVVLATAAQISFASDNRSTSIRVTMLLQQVLWTAWMMGFWVWHKQDEILFIYVVFASIHWALAGSALVGETAPVSPRVRRSLPRSFWARMFTTWLNPGSGTGYVFAVASLAGVAMTATIMAIVGGWSGNARNFFDVIPFSWMAVFYVAAYLGFGRLLVLLLNRYYQFGLALPFLLNIFMALLGAGLPYLVAVSISSAYDAPYSELQMTNWAWTLAEAADHNILQYPLIVVGVGLFGAAMFLINLALAAPETRLAHEAAPQRVVEDELEQHPERQYQPYVRTNPWDEPPADAWQM
jgi:hypothetical protein